MKGKGNTKHAKLPNFWGEHAASVPDETKQFVYEQYLNTETLFVYCDMSASMKTSQIGVAVAYVTASEVIVKHQAVYASSQMIKYSVFGELKALLFALKHAAKHIHPSTHSILFFSDVPYIEKLLSRETILKDPSLVKVQNEVIQVLKACQLKNQHLSFRIQYLPSRFHVHNPFYKAAHNAARKILQR